MVMRRKADHPSSQKIGCEAHFHNHTNDLALENDHRDPLGSLLVRSRCSNKCGSGCGGPTRSIGLFVTIEKWSNYPKPCEEEYRWEDPRSGRNSSYPRQAWRSQMRSRPNRRCGHRFRLDMT